MTEKLFRIEAGYETQVENIYETQVDEETGEEKEVLVRTESKEVWVENKVFLTSAEVEENRASVAAADLAFQKETIRKQIADLNAQITDDVMREYIITNDKSFIISIDNQINVLKNQLESLDV